MSSAPLSRARITYRIGNEHNPANPFGRSELVIETDGRARHILYTLGPAFAWTGIVVADALERFWAALERARFPEFPMIAPPAGATMRALTIGEGSAAATAYLPFHASAVGYDDAFAILDVLLEQMSEGRVKSGRAAGAALVTNVAPAQPPPPAAPEPAPLVDPPGLGPGPAFLLAYLPAHRIAYGAKLAHLETLTDPQLQRARAFGGGALKIGESFVAATDERRSELMRAAGIAPRGDVLSQLTTPAAKAAWKAGETACAVTIAAELAAHVAYFLASAPENTALRAQADEHARVVRATAARLASELAATGRSLANRHKDDAARMVDLTGDSFAELSGLASDLARLFGAMGHHLDDAARRVFDVSDAGAIVLRRVEGWGELEPKVLDAACPDLQPVLERALGLLRDDALRVMAARSERTSQPERSAAPSVEAIMARAKARTKLADDVRARAMAPEDAYERLAPRSWIGDERRWFVTEKVARGTKLDEPMLSVAWTSWVVRRDPSSLDVVTTICADAKNAVLAEDHALEACRLMAIWGWRTPRRVIWLAEERPRFHAYEGARPFRARADEMLRKVFQMERPAEKARDARADPFEEHKLMAKVDLLRAKEWPAAAGQNPFAPIVEIWRLGYALSAVLDVGVVLLANAPKLDDLLEPLVRA